MTNTNPEAKWIMLAPGVQYEITYADGSKEGFECWPTECFRDKFADYRRQLQDPGIVVNIKLLGALTH